MAEKLKSPRPFPILCDVELTNLCNFRCGMCPVGRGVLMRPQGCMGLDLLKKIVDECAANNCAVRLVRWGEPLVHPDFRQALRIVKDAGLLCHINTNGYFLDYGLSCAIRQIELDSIKFSFQGTDEKGYKKFRGPHWGEIITILKHFHALRGDREKPFISVGTTITDENDERVEIFKDFVKPYCDKFTVGKTRNIVGRDGEKGCFPECPEVFDKMSIDWDGNVVACCSDYDRFMTIGDANKNTLTEIWNDGRLKWYREALVAGRHGELTLCSICCANKPMERK